MKLFPADSIGVLQKTLDGLDKQHEAISDNIANVDTPRYKRKDVSFRDQLAGFLEGEQTSLAATNKRHISTNRQDISGVQPKLETRENTNKRRDKNNVDVEVEMAKLAKNTLEYKTATKLLSNQFSRLDNVIKKG